MSERAIRYAVIDAFTDEPFKGNPAAVCLLEDNVINNSNNINTVDEQWMQSVAKEFNISETAFLSRVISTIDSDHYISNDDSVSVPRFNLRWFTPVAEVKLCGHGTLAATHFLYTSGLVKSDTIEFNTKSGVLTAKKIPKSNMQGEEKFSIELDFPVIPVLECDSTEKLSIPETLNGASVVSVMKTATSNDLIVELSSGKEVVDLNPNFTELEKCEGRGVIITGAAPIGSGFDFFTRFFCPKLGVNEDPVCGSAHCALVPYWSKKLQKRSLIAYMASPRSGILQLELEEKTQRVRIRGEAVTVMVGTVLV